MRALKDNRFNECSHPHLAVHPQCRWDLVQEVSLVDQADFLEVDLEVSLVADLEVEVEAILQCRWDLLLPLLPKCNNNLEASHNKDLAV